VNRESRIINLAGKLSLLESAALMKEAQMNFTNDSAPLHLASAVNAPVTVVYCSTTPDFGFGPLSDNSVIVQIQEDLSCRPCGLHGRTSCPEVHFKCAVDINLEALRARI
jgi:heptosyltransferase-2